MERRNNNDIDLFSSNASSRYDAEKRAQLFQQNRYEAQLGRAASVETRKKAQRTEQIKTQTRTPVRKTEKKKKVAGKRSEKTAGKASILSGLNKENDKKVFREHRAEFISDREVVSGEQRGGAKKSAPGKTERKTAGRTRMTAVQTPKKRAPKEKQRNSEKRLSSSRGEQVEMSAQLRRKKKKRRDALLVIALFTLIIAVGYILSSTVLFNADEIDVKASSKKYTEAQILEAGSLTNRTNLLRLDTEEAAAGITSALPYIETVTITRNWPNRLTVEATFFKTVLSVENGSGYTYISPGGKVLETGAASPAKNSAVVKGLPIVSAEPGTAVEFKSTSALSQITALAKAVEANGIKNVTLYDLSSVANVVIEIDSRVRVVVGSVSGAAEKLSFGKVVIEKNLNTKTDDILVVDLTADSKAFVRTQNKIEESSSHKADLSAGTTAETAGETTTAAENAAEEKPAEEDNAAEKVEEADDAPENDEKEEAEPPAEFG